MNRSILYIILLIGVLITIYASIARAETQLDRLCLLEKEIGEVAMTYRQLGGPFEAFAEGNGFSPETLTMMGAAWDEPIETTDRASALATQMFSLSSQIACYENYVEPEAEVKP